MSFMPNFRMGVLNTPLFVHNNIASIHDICNTLNIPLADVARKTGIPYRTVCDYATGKCRPGKERYNLLAHFFDWEEWE